jgi:hypothetical protein
VLNRAGGTKYGGRSGSDPLGLAGELQRSKCGWEPALDDPLDALADLQEGIHGRRGREYRERTDAKESEKQATAYAETFKHRSDPSIRPWST